MSDIVVHEEQILHQEDVRIKMRTFMRQQGIVCQDDDTIETMADKIPNIKSVNSLLDKTITGTIVDNIVTALEPKAFYGCTELVSVSFPEVTDFLMGANEYRTFQGCTNLETAYIPKLALIGANAFNNCSALTEFSAPVATSIGQSAFNNCSALTEFSAPVATSIGQSAFNNCSALTEFSAPVATSIGAWCMSVMTKMEYFSTPKYNGTPNQGTLSTNSQSLILADFGETVQVNGSSSLDSKPDFKYLVLRRKNTISPLSATSVFTGTSGFIIFVPSALITSYQSATNWSVVNADFVSIEGSRFEALDYFENMNSYCELDGIEKRVLDTETVAVFKHTENISRVYENGVELQDTDLVKDKILTSTI